MTLSPNSFVTKPMRPFVRHFFTTITVASSILLSSCASDRFAQRPPAWSETLGSAAESATTKPPTVKPTVAQQAQNLPSSLKASSEFYQEGSGVLVQSPNVVQARSDTNGNIRLNFQSANLLEVVKVILGDTLKVNYAVDPAVTGNVSMITSRPLQRDDLLPTLEMLLRMNGAALVVANDFYRVVPLANAMAEVRAPQLGDSNLAMPKGYSIRVVPLSYVSADEMSQILAPMMTGSNQILRVDSARNLLVVASAGADMDRLLETIDVFDVDRMKGMSVAIFTPDFVDAKTLSEDLEKILNDPQHGLMAGLLRFIVIERINGLMVITPNAEHLAQVRKWVDRLDRNTGDSSPRLFIYRVQNGKATDLAAALKGLFQGGSSSSEPVSLAPGLKPVTIGQAPEEKPDTTPELLGEQAPPTPTNASLSGDQAEGLSISQNSKVQIIADEPNNALLILARGGEYRQILTALKQLDVSPMQVLIEVTIAEVTLTDNLSYGVEWFFKNKVGSKTGIGTLDLGAAGIAALQPGFSYAVQGTDVNAVLNLLATESNLSIISSPSLLVLNNHEATIQVGDEVPVQTQQQQSTATDSAIINSIEYRDTGILLTVKPRINAGGLVIMEVDQEASQAPNTSGTDSLTPRIQQRKISSTVAVNSGDTIILGGLITENRDLSEAGVPGFHKIPVVGALFGNKADNQSRTELIVLITPRAVSDSAAALQVTEEYRRRLKKLIPTPVNKEPETRAEESPPAINTSSSTKPVERSAPPPAPAPTAAPTTAAATVAAPAPQPVPVKPVVTPTPVQAAPPPTKSQQETTQQAQVPQATTAKEWAVQVASFRESERAVALAERLREAGMQTPSPIEKQIDDQTQYRVFVGPEDNFSDAEKLLSQVKDAVGIEGFVKTYP